jgi:hypothetical protein
MTKIHITNAKTGVREPWTYGQIEIDTLNKGKTVESSRVRFIEHNDGKKDNIVTKEKEKQREDKRKRLEEDIKLGNDPLDW